MVAPIIESVIKMSEDLVERILKGEGEYHPRLKIEWYHVYNANKTEIRAYAILTFIEEAYGIYIPPHAYGVIDYYKKIESADNSARKTEARHPYKGIVEIDKDLVDKARSSKRKNRSILLLELTAAHELDHNEFILETMTPFYDLGKRISSTFEDIDSFTDIKLLERILRKYDVLLDKLYKRLILKKIEISAFVTEIYVLLHHLIERNYSEKIIAYGLRKDFRDVEYCYKHGYCPDYELVVYDLFGNFDPNHWMYQKLLKLIKDLHEFSKDKDSIEEMMNYLEKKRERLYNSCARKVKNESSKLSEEFDKLKEEIFRK
jgi:Fe-S-cluster formation regulator IscX/YfhJ